MGRAETVHWECDGPTCHVTENKKVHSRYDESPPKGWSHVSVEIDGESLTLDDCDCNCHDYDNEEWDEDSTPGWHEEEDCECQSWDDEDRGDFYLCVACTGRLKDQFIKPSPRKQSSTL